MPAEWKEVADNTWCLKLESGCLYKVGASVVHVPIDVSRSLNAIARDLTILVRRAPPVMPIQNDKPRQPRRETNDD
jgi:hypothetical protein